MTMSKLFFIEKHVRDTGRGAWNRPDIETQVLVHETTEAEINNLYGSTAQHLKNGEFFTIKGEPRMNAGQALGVCRVDTEDEAVDVAHNLRATG
jgi:hypothetical protein